MESSWVDLLPSLRQVVMLLKWNWESLVLLAWFPSIWSFVLFRFQLSGWSKIVLNILENIRRKPNKHENWNLLSHGGVVMWLFDDYFLWPGPTSCDSLDNRGILWNESKMLSTSQCQRCSSYQPCALLCCDAGYVRQKSSELFILTYHLPTVLIEKLKTSCIRIR